MTSGPGYSDSLLDAHFTTLTLPLQLITFYITPNVLLFTSHLRLGFTIESDVTLTEKIVST